MREIGDSKMTLTYSGFGKNLEYVLDGEDADYLPKVVETFASFLRACGFVYVGAKKVPSSKISEGIRRSDYLIHSDYNWEDEQTLEDDFSFLLDDDYEEENEEQAEINQAAHDYWDKAVDTAVDADELEPYDIGDTVYYSAKGQPDEQHGHNGRSGVKLNMMRGTVVKISDSPLGRRVLVKFDNWNDGHNGMGDDPDARMGASNYWWTDVNNVSLTN